MNTLAEKLSQLIIEHERECEIKYKRMKYYNKNKDIQMKIWELQEKAEKRYLRRPIADYEEVLYYIENICKEMSKGTHREIRGLGYFNLGMTNSDLKKEYDYCEYLVNVKKKIKEND